VTLQRSNEFLKFPNALKHSGKF